MIELLYLIISLFFITSWGSGVFVFWCSLLASLIILNHSFSVYIEGIFSVSGLSSLLVFLSCLLCFLSLVSTPEEKMSEMYLLCLMFLLSVLIMTFSLCNLMMFYIFFEISLIPTLVLIIGWGYQPERLQAGTYMMLYTVGASLPLLLMILWHYNNMLSMNMFILHSLSPYMCGIGGLFIYGAFLVKLPMYGVHLWLPKAHVEAPLAGSMILAGILLKLGGYGIFQANYCFNISFDIYCFVIISISMWGGLIATFMCLRQVDVKSLVAYSSVGHMSIVSSGIILDGSWGVLSALITMVAHGFSSSAMFCLAYFSYKKSHTRSLSYMKGLLQVMPSLSVLWFIFCCINMACPPSLNLMGEMSVIPVLWLYSFFLCLVMGFMVFFSAGYNMYLYCSLNHGSFSCYLSGSSPMKDYCFLSLFGHFFPFLLVLKSEIFNFVFSILKLALIITTSL